MRGGENLSSELINESLVSLVFKQGQSMSLCARVLSIEVNGVEQAFTGGSLRHSRGEKSEDSALNTVNEGISFNLAFSYCLPWLC